MDTARLEEESCDVGKTRYYISGPPSLKVLLNLLISKRAESRVPALVLAVLDVSHAARWAVMGIRRGSSKVRGMEAVIAI
jgi:hypothetical protein